MMKTLNKSLIKRTATFVGGGLAGLAVMTMAPVSALDHDDRRDRYSSGSITVSFSNGKFKKHHYSKGYDRHGYDRYGYNKFGYNKHGYNKHGYNRHGYDKYGYSKSGYNKFGYDKHGYNKYGFNKHGYNKYGYDKHGYNKFGYNKAGYSKHGHKKRGFKKTGHHKKGFGGSKLIKHDVYNTKFHAKIVLKERLFYDRYGKNLICSVSARGPESKYVSYRRLKRIAKRNCSYGAKIKIS